MAGSTLYILSLLYSAQQPAQDRGQKITTAIQTAMQSMTQAPTDSDSELETMARDLKVSYTWFRRAFTQHTGLSPHQYRLQLKIGHARTLLADTQMTVKEVAYQSGFTSDHYFCRLFKAKTGMTPVEWRNAPAA
jgi:AraC-like DNA-binding protein